MSMNHGRGRLDGCAEKDGAVPGARKLRLNSLSSGPFPIEVSRQKTLCIRITRDGNLFRKGRKTEGIPREIHARRMIHHHLAKVGG